MKSELVVNDNKNLDTGINRSTVGVGVHGSSCSRLPRHIDGHLEERREEEPQPEESDMQLHEEGGRTFSTKDEAEDEELKEHKGSNAHASDEEMVHDATDDEEMEVKPN